LFAKRSLGEKVRGLLLIPALVLAALVYAAFDADSGIRTWLQRRSDLEASGIRIEAIRREIRALQRDADALASGPFAIESAIREDLKLARRGEQVVRFAGADDSNPRFP
jgi:cell division protein FtsB